MSDTLILVDLLDRPVGQGEKLDVHKRGLLHRAFSVFLFDGDRLLIQRRAFDKYHSGGLWANSCCSHPRAGEGLDEAVHRRMMQELGMDCAVTEEFAFVYRAVYADGLSEYEYDHVFAGEYSGAVAPDAGEIAEVKWIAADELLDEMAAHPERFSAWFIIAAPELIRRRLHGGG